MEGGGGASDDGGHAIALFKCQVNSHPFQERRIVLSDTAKIGRSVARIRPSADNAIFDCKVLSRNHALLWYKVDKFWMQDTQSSNGTFVNGEQIGKAGGQNKSGEESNAPAEIFSGDLIQFGVNVMENAKKVTHGCIRTTVTLYHPDGSEARKQVSPASNAFTAVSLSSGSTRVSAQELYQLSHYLQEATRREEMLESKLATLQRLLMDTQEASEQGWQSLVDEERMLSRLELLESKLEVYSKSHTSDSLRQEVAKLHDEKCDYETTAKESLRKVLDEKLEAVRKLADIERCLAETEDECEHLREVSEKTDKELEDLADKHQNTLKEFQELKETEEKLKSELESAMEGRDLAETKFTDAVNKKKETTITDEIRDLTEKRDLTAQNCDSITKILEKYRESLVLPNGDVRDIAWLVEEINEDMPTIPEKIDELKKPGIAEKSSADDVEESNEIGAPEAPPPLTNLDSSSAASDKHNDLDNHQDEGEVDREAEDDVADDLPSHELIDNLKCEVERRDDELLLAKENVERLQEELSDTQNQLSRHMARATSLEGQVSDLKNQSEREKNKRSELQSQLSQLHEELQATKELDLIIDSTYPDDRTLTRGDHVRGGSSSDTLVPRGGDEDTTDDDRQITDEEDLPPIVAPSSPKKTMDTEEILHMERLNANLRTELANTQDELNECQNTISNLKDNIKHLNKETRDKILELESKFEHSELSKRDTEDKLVRLTESYEEEKKSNESQVEDYERRISHFITLQSQLELQKKLSQDLSIQNSHLREEMDELRESLKEKVVEAAAHATPSPSSPSQIPSQTSISPSTSLTSSSPASSATSTSPQPPPSPSTAAAAAYQSLKEQCQVLKERLGSVQVDMNRSRSENQQLSAEYSKLQDKYEALVLSQAAQGADLAAGRTGGGVDTSEDSDGLLEASSNLYNNLTDQQKDADQTKLELERARKEIANLTRQVAEEREKYEAATAAALSEPRTPSPVVDGGAEKSDAHDYQQLQDRANFTSLVSAVPLLILLLAILIAFYPTLSRLTATNFV